MEHKPHRDIQWSSITTQVLQNSKYMSNVPCLGHGSWHTCTHFWLVRRELTSVDTGTSINPCTATNRFRIPRNTYIGATIIYHYYQYYPFMGSTTILPNSVVHVYMYMYACCCVPVCVQDGGGEARATGTQDVRRPSPWCSWSSSWEKIVQMSATINMCNYTCIYALTPYQLVLECVVCLYDVIVCNL